MALIDVCKSADLHFWDLVGEAFSHKGIKRYFVTQGYIALLLERFVLVERSAVLYKPLMMELYYFTRHRIRDRLVRLREVGDAALFTAGIIAPFFRRRMNTANLLEKSHYVRVARHAYRALAGEVGRRDDFYDAYRIIATSTGRFVGALNFIAEEKIFRPKVGYILRVYEELEKEGGENARRWFEEHGLVLLAAEFRKEVRRDEKGARNK